MRSIEYPGLAFVQRTIYPELIVKTRIALGLIIASLLFGCSDNKIIAVGLQPFDNFNPTLIDTVAIAIEKVYDVKVIRLQKKQIPEEAFTNVKTPRYRADQLIKYLRDEKPDTLDYIIGFTNRDISTTKRDEFGNIKKPEKKYNDWGIFGLGYRPGPSCVISSFRLNNKREKIVFDRVKKVSVHELGHNLGLDHCESEFCVMRDAVETIKTVDKVKLELCGPCKKKLM